jgi:hypothetical protein
MKLKFASSLLKNLLIGLLIFCIWGFSTPKIRVLAATMTDNTQATFNGTYTATQWDATNLAVRQTNASQPGTYVSPVFDSTSTSTNWQNIAWTTKSPHEKNLPDNGGSDSGYTNNLSMTGNLGLWHMDEATAIARTDSSGLGNNTTCATTCPAVFTTGLLNRGMTSGATNTEYLNTTNGNSVKNTSEFTISVWIRPTTLSGVKVIYEEPTSTLNSRQRVSLRLNGTAVNFIGRTNDSAAAATNWVISSTVLAINNWYHLVAIFNSNTDIHQLYINNVVQNSSVVEIPIPNTNPIVTPKISQQATGTGAKFLGNIDELAIWNRALSANEVENAFLRGFRLRFQVQTCTAVALCTAANFKGPGGTNATWYTELNNSTLTPPSFALNTTTTPNRQYFQYQAQFQNFTTASTQSALLNSFTVTYSNPPLLPSLALAIRKNDDTIDSLICDLGTVTTAATANCSYRLKVSSSSPSGYTIFVKTSGNLTDGTSNISNALAGPTGTDISGATLGTENYGVNIVKGSATGGTTTLSAAFSAGTNEVLFTPVSATSLIASNGPNLPAATDLTNTSLITHQLNISNATKAGNYSQTITYTVLATF